jgi:outer membrane protein
MKNLILIILLAVGIAMPSVHAQKIAVINLTDILESMPEYRKAQEELDKIAGEWRQEIANEYDKIKSMYNKYQAEQVLMSDDMRRQKEDEIVQKEKEVRDMQREKFGPEGALFIKRQELVQPIQEKVFAAIDAYAKERALDIILDKEAAAGVLFVNEALDRTDDIKRKLNIRN